MDFEDFLEKKSNPHKKYKTQKHHYETSRNYVYYSGGQYNKNPLEFINRLKSNKKFRIFILVAGIVIVFVIIGIIALLFPLVSKIFDYITQNGISGITEIITDFLNTLWNGTK